MQILMMNFKLWRSSQDPRFNEISGCEMNVVAKKFSERFFKDGTPETSISADSTVEGSFDF